MSTPPRGILPAFGLPEVNVVALSGGLSGTTWKATVGRQAYVVRRHDPPGQTTATVISELAWLDALATDTSPPTPDPVRRADGELADALEEGSARLAEEVLAVRVDHGTAAADVAVHTDADLGLSFQLRVAGG